MKFYLIVFAVLGLLVFSQAQAALDKGAGSGPQGLGESENTQQKVQTPGATENQTKAQVQDRQTNQGEDNQISNQEQAANSQQNGESAGEGRRSQVANAVHELLQMADRSGGLGEQIRVVAQNQNQSQERIEASLMKAEGRNRFVRFLIGPDYGELEDARRALEQNREEIRRLAEVKNQLANTGERLRLEEQIGILERVNSETEGLLKDARRGFSLLGWMFNLLSR